MLVFWFILVCMSSIRPDVVQGANTGKSVSTTNEPGSEADIAGSQCAICYDDLGESSDDWVVLRCGHKYHIDCLAKWTQQDQFTSDSCPACRGPLVLKENKLFGDFARERGEKVDFDIAEKWLPKFGRKELGFSHESLTMPIHPSVRDEALSHLKLLGMCGRTLRRPTCRERAEMVENRQAS